MRNHFRSSRLTLVEILIGLAICLTVAGAIYSLTYMAVNDCHDGLWVRDAMGMPRCIHTQNVNLLVH